MFFCLKICQRFLECVNVKDIFFLSSFGNTSQVFLCWNVSSGCTPSNEGLFFLECVQNNVEDVSFLSLIFVTSPYLLKRELCDHHVDESALKCQVI